MEEVDKIIDNKMRRNFKMTMVPVDLLKDFKVFCREECGDIYSVGLFQLMKTKKMYENMLPLLSNVLEEVAELKSKLQPQSSKRRTFGDE